MRRPARRMIVICPGRPVQRSPAFLSARSVERWPAGPKSSAWLLARFITSKPAAVMSFAKLGGAWNAKQLGEPPHFVSGSAESVSSRFAKARSAERSGPMTGAMDARPEFGGMPYFEASTVSPTQAIVTRLLRSGAVAVVVDAVVCVTVVGSVTTVVAPPPVAVAVVVA